MNNILIYSTVLIISLPIIGCGGGKTPYPDQLENKTLQTDILNIFADSVEIAQTEHFFELEKSVEDVQKEIEVLRTRVMKYEHKYPEPNYTKQLKELINKPPPAHKISLKNGSIIKGTIEKDRLDYI